MFHSQSVGLDCDDCSLLQATRNEPGLDSTSDGEDWDLGCGLSRALE